MLASRLLPGLLCAPNLPHREGSQPIAPIIWASLLLNQLYSARVGASFEPVFAIVQVCEHTFLLH